MLYEVITGAGRPGAAFPNLLKPLLLAHAFPEHPVGLVAGSLGFGSRFLSGTRGGRRARRGTIGRLGAGPSGASDRR